MTEQNQKVEKYRNYFLGASVVVLVLLLGFLFLINMGSFGSLTDKGSLTLTDLKKLDYPATHPGFLACDPADCPAALPNRGAYAFAVPAQKLRQIIVALSDIDPTIELKNFDMPTATFDFTVKVKKRAFPAVVTIKITESPDAPGYSKMAFYSRHIIGDATPSEDAKRAVDWVNYIRRKAAE